MSESVVADFVAEAVHDGLQDDEAARSRVLLSEDRLVLASADGRTAIDLEDVFDVVVTRIPEELGSFLDQSVLVAYATAEDRRTVQIRGEHDRIDRFATFLYKAVLRGEGAEIRHAVREGGRVLDPPRRPVAVEPTPDAITFRRDGEVTIDLEDVTEVVYERREVDGEERPVLSVRHVTDGTATTTEVFHASPHRLNVLARHLRTEYYRAEEVLAEIDLSDRETQALVALYGGVDPSAVSRVVAEERRDDLRGGSGLASPSGPVDTGGQGGVGGGADADDDATDESAAILEALVEKGLVDDADTGRLTHDGALVAVHRIDDVAE